jgi:hypothetical protein
MTGRVALLGKRLGASVSYACASCLRLRPPSQFWARVVRNGVQRFTRGSLRGLRPPLLRRPARDPNIHAAERIRSRRAGVQLPVSCRSRTSSRHCGPNQLVVSGMGSRRKPDEQASQRFSYLSPQACGRADQRMPWQTRLIAQSQRLDLHESSTVAPCVVARAAINPISAGTSFHPARRTRLERVRCL